MALTERLLLILRELV